ncbi:lytic transglycosylase domain-containing protein [Heliorestis convoluta]|uniref:Lytic transglycosylase domain-containing protein n=1 Tax=Heliorestis convoluta TaxID=356322 RepID=A0A5Q2N255_9FIRM|nr:lytic transglycosylase domain-containing protein [Heliorestis convoluta]QGG49078.1 lytic transglycosylase domain-containing protein [Heliorestis convoluta]
MLRGPLVVYYRLSRPRMAVAILALIILGNFFWFSPWVQKIFYPIPHKQTIFKYAAQYNLDPYLVTAIMRRESKFWIWAESPQGARGLMQLMPQTAEWIAHEMKMDDYELEKLYEPDRNIKMACWYLANLKQEFQGNMVLVIAAYNGGRGNVRQWLEEKHWTGQVQSLDQIPYPETREYVKGVLADYQIYRHLYDPL